MQFFHDFSFRSCCSIEIIYDGGGAIENTGGSALEAVFEQADAKLRFFFMTLQQANRHPQALHPGFRVEGVGRRA